MRLHDTRQICRIARLRGSYRERYAHGVPRSTQDNATFVFRCSSQRPPFLEPYAHQRRLPWWTHTFRHRLLWRDRGTVSKPTANKAWMDNRCLLSSCSFSTFQGLVGASTLALGSDAITSAFSPRRQNHRTNLGCFSIAGLIVGRWMFSSSSCFGACWPRFPMIFARSLEIPQSHLCIVRGRG